MVCVVAGPPADEAGFTITDLIGLALQASLVDAVLADGTVLNSHVPTPQCHRIPLLYLDTTVHLHLIQFKYKFPSQHLLSDQLTRTQSLPQEQPRSFLQLFMSSILNPPSPSQAILDQPSFCSLADGSSHRKRQFMRKPAASPSLLVTNCRKKEGDRDKRTEQPVPSSIKSWREEKKQQGGKSSQQAGGSYHQSGLCQNGQVRGDICQRQLLMGIKYIQKPAFHFSSGVCSPQQEPLSQRREPKKDLDETVDVSCSSQPQSSRTSQAARPPQCFQPSDNSRSQPSRPRVRGDREQNQCPTCRSYQEKWLILQERSWQLEQQLEAKSRMIIDLTKREESLQSEKGSIKEQMGSVIEELESRIRQNEKNLACTFSAAKEEISKLNERLKYADMQNGMLLRFKEQFTVMVKESDRLRKDNLALKKQLNVIAKMEKVELEGGRDRATGKGRSRRGREEDMISLDLSEWSTEQL